AFAFSMSVNRYENRRSLILTEANAITNLDLMAEAVGQASTDQLRAELRPYAQARLEASLSSGVKRDAALMRVAAERATLGASVRQAMRAHEGSTAGVALGQAYDGMSDAAADRDAAALARLPGEVLALLSAYCIAAAGVLGYAIAADRSRHRAASWALFILLALAFGTIVDLDRPRSGAITVSQEPLAEAVRSLR